MNGKKAKTLRAAARANAYSSAALRISYTVNGIPMTARYPEGHFRRIYQDSKRRAT